MTRPLDYNERIMDILDYYRDLNHLIMQVDAIAQGFNDISNSDGNILPTFTEAQLERLSDAMIMLRDSVQKIAINSANNYRTQMSQGTWGTVNESR